MLYLSRRGYFTPLLNVRIYVCLRFFSKVMAEPS